MTRKLSLGVLDLPYADAASYREVGKRKNKKASASSVTTAEVAKFLEDRYGIMGFFFEKHGDFIADKLAESYENILEAMAMGAPATIDPFGPAAQAIQSRFREMLTNREMDGQIAGVPTEASKEGHSSRKKKPGKRRKSRPSFIDTGLYEGAFRIWKDDEE